MNMLNNAIYRSIKYFATLVLLIAISNTSTWAQQPTTQQQIPNPSGPVPPPVTKDQVQKIIEQQKQGSEVKQEDQGHKNTDAVNDQEQPEDEEDKSRKYASGTEDPDQLPVFGNNIFANNSSDFAPNTNRPTPLNYILGPGDALQIDVTGNSVVSWNLNISADGSILLPGMGKLYIGGSTIENATAAIKGRLNANNFAVDRGTNVSVTLSNIRTMRITVMGEVRNPGTYNVSSLTTAFNALYLSGGISENGSFRNIEIIRDNQLMERIDIYDYLLRGDLSSNITLKDDDVIRVPEYKTRVSITGEIKRPAYFEMMPGESLSELVRFAGGFTDMAYTSMLKVTQVTDKQYRVKDISFKDFDNYTPLKGDQFEVGKIIERFENRITLNGAVFRPGQFELESNATLRTLIANAEGLKEEAYPERGYITRMNPDNSMAVIPFFVKGIVDGTSEDIALQREDVVTIPSIFDIAESYAVSIRGSVRNPGSFPFNADMTVEDLILQAGGFIDGANMQRVEIARRIRNSDKKLKNARLAEIITIDIDPQLKLSESKLKLQPYDVISIYQLPGFMKSQIVKVEGEVMRPGYFAMTRKDERLSDLIKRVDGLTDFAYLKGATFKREEYNETSTDKQISDLKIQQMQQGQMEATGNDSAGLKLNSLVKRNNFVGIDFEYALKHPGSSQDLILMDGDIINIPRELQTVKISGEVNWPTTAIYRPGMNAKDYILEYSGGFKEDAQKKNVNVILANGQTKATRKYLFHKKYPEVEPGAEIFVPYKKKVVREPMSAQAWIGLGSSLASLAAIVFGIISISKN